MTKSVFLLWHVHEFEDGREDEKFIGVYATRVEAEAAIKRVAGQPGFRRQPNGFLIDEYELGKDHWTEGYATMYPDGTFSN